MNTDLQEVEERAKLKDGQEALIKSKLAEAGANLESTSSLSDVYYCKKEATSIEEVEMREIGSYSLRIRHKVNNGAAISELNAKQTTKYFDHSAWNEFETKISDEENAARILDVVGFKPFLEIKKTRCKYVHNGINVLLDDIYDFGKIIELEGFAPKNQAEAMKQKLIEEMKFLGIDEGQITKKAITYEIMKKNAKF